MTARVLVVDDSPTVRKVVSSILSRSGYDVTLAQDGYEALNLLSGRGEFGLMLLDFVMPKMTGYELCRKLRAVPRHKALPVVLMSAKAEKIRDQFMEQTGALDAITKPFDPRGLVAVVEAALQKAEARKHAKSIPPPRETDSLLLPSDPPVSLPGEVSLPDAIGDLLTKAGLGEKAAFMTKLSEVLDKDAVQALARVVEKAKERLGGKEILRGDATAIPLAEVLQLLSLQMQSGLLHVATLEREVSVIFRDGMVDVARSRGVADEFRLGRYLLEDGIVTEDQLADAIRDAKDSNSLLGEVVVARGLAISSDVDTALTRQTSELVFEMLSWKRASFTFARMMESDEELTKSPKLGLPVAGLVMEAYQRVDEWQQIEKHLHFDQGLVKNPSALGTLPAGKLSAFELKMLDLVDGDTPVREIVKRSSASSFDACKALFQFIEARLVRGVA